MLFEDDYLRLFLKALEADIHERSLILGEVVLPHEQYVHQVGMNEGLRRAMEILKTTASGLRGDDDED